MHRRISMATCRAIVALGLVAGVLGGCSRNEQNGTASGVSGTGSTVTGDGGISTAPGGQGSGMTGTQGAEPADNPAADASEAQQSEGAEK